MGWLKHGYGKYIITFVLSALIFTLLTPTDLAGVSAKTPDPGAYWPNRPSAEVLSLRAYPTEGNAELGACSNAARAHTVSFSRKGLVERADYPTQSRENDPGLKVVVRGEQGPMLFIGGSIGISGEVFLGDMPVPPDPYAAEAGDDNSAGGESGAAGNTEGDSGNSDQQDAGQTKESAGSSEGSDSGGSNSGGSASEEDDWDSYLPPKPQGVTLPGIRQNLDLVIDAILGESVQAYARLSMSGVWGVSRPSDVSPWMPSMVRPLLVDEAWVRYATEDFQVHAGKQRFSLGPIGLLARTDLEAAEGIVADTGSEKWHLTGVWSRLSSGYYYNSSFVTKADDLLAFRFAWPMLNTWALGINYLASGLGDETGVSVDVLGNIAGRNIAAELGMFESSSTLYPEYQTSGRVPGLVLKIEAINTPQHRLEFSYGYIARGFAPYYSSVASRSGGYTIPFDQNTQGIAVDYDRRIAPATEVNVKAACLRFLDGEAARSEGAGEGENNDSEDGSETNRVAQSQTLMAQSAITPVVLGSASVRHELKKNIFAEGKYEHWWMEEGSSYGRLFAGITMSF